MDKSELITISFVELRNELIQRGTPRSIPLSWAYLIQAFDKKESFVHVEFLPNGERPLLWHITDWLETFEHRAKLKYDSEAYRQASYVQARNKARALAALKTLTGLNGDDAEKIMRQIFMQSSDKVQAVFQTWKCKYEHFVKLDEEMKPVVKVFDYSKENINS
jgi:hypothetical protein